MGLLDMLQAEAAKWGNGPSLGGLLMRDESTQGLRDYAGNVQQRGAALIGLLQGREPTDAQKALFSGLDPTTDEGAMNFALTFAGPMAKTANLAKLKIAEQRPKTQYELAHELAQRNAALPIEQGGLGLHPNNTAMDRAKAMGFDTPAYHGTKTDIKAFDPLKHGTSSGHASANVPAVWVTGRPEVANIFTANDVLDAYPISRYGNIGGGLASIRPYNYIDQGNVIPLMIRAGDNIQTIKAGEAQRLIFGEKGDDWRDAGEAFVKEYKERGSPDVLKIKGHPLSELEFRANQYLLADPSRIRSRFAAFDPMQSNSSDLLAGVAPYAIPAGLAGLLGMSMMPQDAMADDKKTKK